MALTPTQEAQVLELVNQQAALLSLAGNESTITSKLAATKVNLGELTPAVSLADADLLLVRQGTTDKSTTGALVKTLAQTGAVLTTGAQNVDGVKTFTSTPVVPDDSFTFAKLQNVATATILGRTTAGTGDTEALTATQATAIILAASETVSGRIELATAAEAIAGTDAVRAITPAGLRSGLNASGTAPIYACRAWVNFNGTGVVAIRGSGNVSSITDNGVGNYTINFTTAMPDINYSAVSTTMHTGGPYIVGHLATSFNTGSYQLAVSTYLAAQVDVTHTTVAIFR